MVRSSRKSIVRRAAALVVGLAGVVALMPSAASAQSLPGRAPAPLAGTTVTVTAMPNPATVFQDVTFTAVVDCTGGGDPTGTVTFTDRTTGSTLGTVSEGTPGPDPDQRTYTLAPVHVSPIRSHDIEAAYVSTNPSCPDATGTMTIPIVRPGTSTTTASASPNPTSVGTPTTLTANVVCTSGSPAGDKVEFSDGPDVLGDVPITSRTPTTGTASLTTTFTTPGTHTIYAVYTGTETCTSSYAVVALEVRNDASTTTVSATPNPVQFGQPVTLTATVTCTTGNPAGGTVTFTDTTTGNLLGESTVTGGPLSGRASLTVNGLTPGTHAVTATFRGTTGCASSSGTVTVTVAVSQTLSGNVPHGVTITVPTTMAPGTRIHGDVIISGFGALNAEGVQIFGNLTTVGGTALRLCGSTVWGGATVSGVRGVVVIGDAGDDGNPPCPGNTFRGVVTLNGINGYLEFSGNTALASVTVSGTITSSTVPPENSPTTELESNHITGNLICNGNMPPPVNDGRPNVVGGLRIGQCTGL